jgi:hypothetical protein
MLFVNVLDIDFLLPLVKNLLGAGAAAALVYLAGRLRHYRRKKIFQRCFGSGVVTAKDVVMTVPLWCSIEGERKVPRFVKKSPGRTEQRHYGPDQMYNRQDMLAAAHVLSVLNSHFEEEVSYSNDGEIAIWDQKTVVLIGSPLVNFHGQDYLDKYKQERPNDLFPYFLDRPERKQTGGDLEICDPRNGETYRSDDKNDYGLVLRLPNVFSKDATRHVFLIAGIHEWSTREAGRLFNAQWRTLGEEGLLRRLVRAVLPRRWQEAPAPAGFVFRMNWGENGIGTGMKL